MRSIKFVIALCVLAGTQLASGAQEYQDAVTEGAKIVFPDPKSKPVGFEATRDAVVRMLELMNSSGYRDDVEADDFMSQTKLLLERAQDVCQLNKAKCVSIFPEIDLLKEEFEGNINMLPYVNACEARQNDFCSGRDDDKPGPFASFFTRIATVCSPKDKNCDRKNKN